ncbi:histidinol dehydrogenase [Blattabacterium cuenoti]|uniref:histidinol dehydrogenase n=1 Tax=Blattabacterium cuenoti TaxID=1653831 RepID=UPI00163C3C04|nr:histidinol dehydrogenase [Blattabacterium cuenoti]
MDMIKVLSSIKKWENYIVNKKNLKQKYNTHIIDIVFTIINNVKLNGDLALKKYSIKYDNVQIENFKVEKKDFQKAFIKTSNKLKKSIEKACNNIKSFHNKQIYKENKIEISSGILCWRKNIPIEKVGFYIPGGTAPLLSTILMLGIPAKLAGCKNIILCTPPDKYGEINPSLLYTAKYLDIDNIYKVGGAQAIAAMAYGTESIPNVYKIFGPGNTYVTTAKKIISQDNIISVDFPAGPSEIVIIADEYANPKYVASDLLSQSEHDIESFVLLLTINKNFWIKKMKEELKKQFLALDKRTNIVKKSLENSKILILSSLEECISLANEIAPEHLILNCYNACYFSEKIINAGSVFLGNYSPVSAGDYATGTNHVLPTHGYAKSYSGLSVDSFLKKITFQKLSKKGLNNLSECIGILSLEEGLMAHKNSVDIRFNDI